MLGGGVANSGREVRRSHNNSMEDAEGELSFHSRTDPSMSAGASAGACTSEREVSYWESSGDELVEEEEDEDELSSISYAGSDDDGEGRIIIEGEEEGEEIPLDLHFNETPQTRLSLGSSHLDTLRERTRSHSASLSSPPVSPTARGKSSVLDILASSREATPTEGGMGRISDAVHMLEQERTGHGAHAAKPRRRKKGDGVDATVRVDIPSVDHHDETRLAGSSEIIASIIAIVLAVVFVWMAKDELM